MMNLLAARRPTTSAAAGFTLIELLISMLVLAIGIMAALSMQFTALGSAVTSRDNSNAADLAHRVMQIMRVESQQWQDNGIDTDVSAATYSTSAFTKMPLLAAVNSATKYVPLVDQPVDPRLSTAGITRYCIYGVGQMMSGSKDAFMVNIAVVYPEANGAITGDKCLKSTSLPFELNPSIDPTAGKSAQMNGYRVEYFGTQISRRGYLAGL